MNNDTFLRVLGSTRHWTVNVCRYVLKNELYVSETCEVCTSKAQAEAAAVLWSKRRQLPVSN
jgi:hypothetical protein